MKRRIASSIHSRGKLLLAALCVSVALGAFAVQALGSFGKARNFAVGAGPSSVAIGDLNGDNKRDLAVANSGSDTVSILLGNGAGSFGKAKNFAVGTHPTSVAIGDLNGDGNPDLAVTNWRSNKISSSNNVSVLLGNGDGSFGAARNFAVGAKPDSVAIGNLNGDGNPDLAVANYGSSSNAVSVLLGNGDGSFGAATNFAVGTGPVSVAIGDLNGDGNPDLAVTSGRRTNVVSVLLGDGDGTFGAAMYFAVGLGPTSVAIGDLNGDGKPDLAVANGGSYKQQPSTVSILLGNGAGNFGAAKNFAAGVHPSEIAVDDLNGDNKPDLAVANATSGSGPGHVSILLGNGAGSFAAPKHLRVGLQPSSVAIGNLNAGSNPDLAVANYGSNNVSILLNGGPSPRTLTLSYRRNKHRFTGRLSSFDPTCIRSQRVRVLRRRPGRDQKVGAAITSKSGTYSIRRNARRGTYYARVRPWSACRAENSKAITLR